MRRPRLRPRRRPPGLPTRGQAPRCVPPCDLRQSAAAPRPSSACATTSRSRAAVQVGSMAMPSSSARSIASRVSGLPPRGPQPPGRPRFDGSRSNGFCASRYRFPFRGRLPPCRAECSGTSEIPGAHRCGTARPDLNFFVSAT